MKRLHPAANVLQGLGLPANHRLVIDKVRYYVL